MGDQPQPTAISAAYPAPPPFYKSFTPQNLESHKEHLKSTNSTSPNSPPTSTHLPNLLSLPPSLRNLVPPPQPSNGQYRSFGTLRSITPPPESQNILPTPSRLKDLTQSLLLTFLALINVLATNPGAWAPLWDHLHEGFQEVHRVMNGYRPHQARETLILMMEEQIEKVRGETRAVRESVGSAREVVEGLGRGGEGVEDVGARVGKDGGKRQMNTGERRIWELLDRDVGRI